MLASFERSDLGTERRSWRCLRSWKSCAMKRWPTLLGTVVWEGGGGGRLLVNRSWREVGLL